MRIVNLVSLAISIERRGLESGLNFMRLFVLALRSRKQIKTSICNLFLSRASFMCEIERLNKNGFLGVGEP